MEHNFLNHMASRSSATAGPRKQASRSRRTTCDICRERKVRCDKEQPACERCKRLNLMCTYTPGSDSVDVTQTLSHLHERLANAEAIISGISPSSVPSPPAFTHHNLATSGLDMPGSPSSNVFFGLDDPNLPYFPHVEEKSLSQDFVNSWNVDREKFHGYTSISEPMHQLPDIDVAGTEGLESLFPGTLQSKLMSKKAQLNITPVASNHSFDFQTASLSSINASSVAILSIGGSPVGQNVISQLHRRYFMLTRPEVSSIDPDRFFRLLGENPVKHQVSALSYAIAITGASLSDEFPNLKSLFYGTARQYLELAERQEDGSDFLNLETVQALVLILRHEFGEAKGIERVMMTNARLMRLIKLLHLGNIDAGELPTEVNGLYVPPKSSIPLAAKDEERRTFWFAFILNFFVSSLTDSLPALQTSEILTYIPSPLEGEIEGPLKSVFLNDAIPQPSITTFSNFKPLILATALGNQSLQHVSLSKQQNSALAYDFWTSHYKLDKVISLHLAQYMLPASDTPQVEYIMLLISHFTLLGSLILIHMRAFERALEADFPESVASSCRQRFETLAMRISENCQEGGEFGYLKLNGRNYLSMSLTWPICLAARAQVLSIKNPIRYVDPNSIRPASKGSLRASLMVLESVIKSFGVVTSYSRETLEEIRLVLDDAEDSSMICWPNMLM